MCYIDASYLVKAGAISKSIFETLGNSIESIRNLNWKLYP